jgi:hypothetical protein
MSVASPRRTHERLLLSIKTIVAFSDLKDDSSKVQTFCRKTELVRHWADKLSAEDPALYATEKETVESSLAMAASVLEGWCRRLVDRAMATRSQTSRTTKLGRALYHINHYVVPWLIAANRKESVVELVSFAVNGLVVEHFPMGRPDARNASYYRRQFIEAATYADAWGVPYNGRKLGQLVDSYS